MSVVAAVAGMLMYETSKRLDEETENKALAVPDGTAKPESNNHDKENK